MGKKVLSTVLMPLMLCSLVACGTTGQQEAEIPDISENSSYESVAGLFRNCLIRIVVFI